MVVAYKSQYFVVDTKPFPANQNVKYECSHCVLTKYSFIIAGSYKILFLGLFYPHFEYYINMYIVYG